MQQLRRLGVRNLRSFKEDKQYIDLKKINILVGKNSCGKSTFARVFPLLKQSLRAKTEKTPILWNGSILDFGDFSTAVRDGETAISFDFEFNLDISTLYNRFKYKHRNKNYMDEKPVPIELSLTIEENRTRQDRIQTTNTIVINSKDSVISLKYGESILFEDIKITILKNTGEPFVYNLIDEIHKSGAGIFAFRSSEFLPDSIEYGKVIRDKDDQSIQGIENILPLENYATKQITQILKKYFRKGSSTKNIDKICSRLPWTSPELFYDLLRDEFSEYKTFTKALENPKNQEDLYLKIYPLTIILSLRDYLKSINRYLNFFCNNINYIAPIRAISERYYRYQNLSVDEMDSTGMNLPMVINSLPPKEQIELSNWIYKNFLFHITLEVSGQHYELKVKENHDKEFHNISDMGFGYSQILPIIVSIWLENSRSNKRFFLPYRMAEKTYVIEQPELHLHPALQYKFGVMLAKVISENKSNNVHFIIETHSKSIIDALGDQIRKDIIKHNDVGINLFEKNENSQTEVRSASFSQDGYLEDWPLGFLTA